MTFWFTQRKDDPRGLGIRVLQGSEGEPEDGTFDPSTLLIVPDDAVPHYVRTPPEIGDEVVRVLGRESKPCLLCLGQRIALDGDTIPTLRLERGLWVGECGVHGFCWYSTGPKTAPEAPPQASAQPGDESSR